MPGFSVGWGCGQSYWFLFSQLLASQDGVQGDAELVGSDGGDGDGGQVYPGAAGQDQGGQGAGQDNTG